MPTQRCIVDNIVHTHDATHTLSCSNHSSGVDQKLGETFLGPATRPVIFLRYTKGLWPLATQNARGGFTGNGIPLWHSRERATFQKQGVLLFRYGELTMM